MGTLGLVGSADQYEFESACSTPYVSAPSSPGRIGSSSSSSGGGGGGGGGGYFFSAPTSPLRVHSSCRMAAASASVNANAAAPAAAAVDDDDFDFSARFVQVMGGQHGSNMSSADELFQNGQIRPMRLSSHLQKPQQLAPLLDFPEEDERDKKPSAGTDRPSADRSGRFRRDKSRGHRRTRSLSPLRAAPAWVDHEQETTVADPAGEAAGDEKSKNTEPETEADSASSAAAAAASARTRRRGSRRWSIKDLFLYRSKSEGRAHAKERLWALAFSADKNKNANNPPLQQQQQHSFFFKKEKEPASGSNSCPSKKDPVSASQKAATVTAARRGGVAAAAASVGQSAAGQRKQGVSAHELHYTANRAQAEELRRKTYLPYRQGLLGCLGFPSKSYTTVNGFARSLHPLSSS